MGKYRYLSLVVVALFGLSSCITTQSKGDFSGAVGMNEAQLEAQRGRPQKIIDAPAGGKILVYETSRIDQMATMGTGAWSKTEQIYYWLDSQGKVTKVDYYPYGKRKFLFPSANEPEKQAASPAPVAIAPTPIPPPQVSRREEIEKPGPSPSPAVTDATPLAAATPATKPQKASPIVAKPTAPVVSTGPKGMREAARLEHAMSKEEVTRLLGIPERTEGFRVDGKQVVVWSYRLSDQTGRRVLTPLIFENNRLTGWGDTYYQMLLSP
jgi:Protein of unknown function (DUF3192)